MTGRDAELLDEYYSPDPLSGTVVRQTEFDITIEQCIVSHRNLAYAVLIRLKILSDDEVKVCLQAPMATVCFVSLS